MKASGYSLWISPMPGMADQYLQGLIDHFSGLMGSPLFHAHTTLLGGIEGEEHEILRRARSLADWARPFNLEPDEIRTSGEEYHRAVVAILSSPGRRFEALNSKAREFFGIDAKFLPHLSFAYGNFTPRQLEMMHQELVRSDLSQGKFTAISLDVWKTEGEVNEWRLVETFPFGRDD